MENNANAGRADEVTLVFHPQSGGAVPERASRTSILRAIVSLVLQKLNAQNVQNPTVQRRKDGAVLSLDATLEALGLDNGEQLNLAWQTSGGV